MRPGPRYALLSLAALAYGVLLGDNWHWYAMALMLAAIRAHRRRFLAAQRPDPPTSAAPGGPGPLGSGRRGGRSWWS